MKPKDSERYIIKDMIKEGIRLPEDERLTEKIMQQVKQEPLQQTERSYVFLNPSGVLMIFFLVVLAVVPFTRGLIGVIQTNIQADILVRLDEIVGQLNAYLFYSPLFLLSFLVFFLLYKLDRFLEKRSALE
ncbi:MAG TPA: hypothetical protein VJ876_05710 [Bacteroidales bacterium]|nr:hypothetical protein [Bacteroidales bacterium]